MALRSRRFGMIRSSGAAVAVMFAIAVSAIAGAGSEWTEHTRSMMLTHRKVLQNGSEAPKLQDPTLALLSAARSGNLEGVRTALEEGADINAVNSMGFSALILAARENNIQILNELLWHGADTEINTTYGTTALWDAAYRGYVDAVQSLLAANAVVDSMNVDGWTPLMIAADEGHLNVVRALALAGANVNALNKLGSTPLIIAVDAGYVDIVNFLLNSGAAVDAKRDDSGQSALWYASFLGYEDVVDILIQNNAAVDLPDTEGRTPLFAAAQQGHNPVVMKLIETGADVDASMPNGFTALHVAAAYGRINVATSLIKAGANAKKKDHSGRRPIDVVGTARPVSRKQVEKFSTLFSAPEPVPQMESKIPGARPLPQTRKASNEPQTESAPNPRTVAEEPSTVDAGAGGGNGSSSYQIILGTTIVGATIVVAAFVYLLWKNKIFSGAPALGKPFTKDASPTKSNTTSGSGSTQREPTRVYVTQGGTQERTSGFSDADSGHRRSSEAMLNDVHHERKNKTLKWVESANWMSGSRQSEDGLRSYHPEAANVSSTPAPAMSKDASWWKKLVHPIGRNQQHPSVDRCKAPTSDLISTPGQNYQRESLESEASTGPIPPMPRFISSNLMFNRGGGPGNIGFVNGVPKYPRGRGTIPELSSGDSWQSNIKTGDFHTVSPH